MITARAVIVFSLMSLFLCFEMALQVSPGVMTAELREALHISAYGLGMMSGCYFVTYSLMQIPSGLMYDRANFRMLVTITISICAVGAGVFGLADSLITGVAARLLMGFGSAFAFLSVLTVAARCFPSRYFAFLTGIAQLLAALGAIAGEIPIAWAVNHIGWRQTLWALMALGLLLAACVWIFLKKPQEHCKVQMADKPESSRSSLQHIVKNKQTWWIACYAFFNWAPVTAFASLWGVPFLATSYQISTQEAASLCSLIWLGIGLSSPFIGALSDRIGRRKPLLALTALIGGISIAIIIYVPGMSMSLLGTLLFLAGMGSSGQILSFAVVQDFAAPSRISASIGFNNMALVASGVIMQPLVGKLLAWNDGISSTIQTYTISSFQHALITLPLAFSACVIISLFFIKETFTKN
ncbi:MAG: MFS transporter [Gammaproteobacteria bacterium]|nr:MFS transporter [Gammaproteobacteria bacterium]